MRHERRAMKAFSTLAMILLFSSCAQTVFYHEGKPVARFQGDMTNMTYRQDKDGAISWSSSAVSHSVATLAQGTAASDKIGHLGTAVATAGIMALAK